MTARPYRIRVRARQSIMTPQRERGNAKCEQSRRHAGTNPIMSPNIISNAYVINEYLHAHRDRWRPSTIRLRRIQLRALAEALHPVDLINATEDDLYRWRDHLVGAPETLSSYVSATRGLYRWMSTRARPRLRVDDPSAVLDRPKVPPRLPRPMLDAHFDLALRCATTRPELFVWLVLAGCSGLRCCEIAWMQTTDVEERDRGGALLHIVGKGGKRRTVPAGAALMEAMRPFLRGPRGPVFTRPSDGRAHTPDRVSQLINRFLRDLDIHETAHSLRHRFGTDYHAIDPDLFRQASLMGHASLDMTRRYTEVSPTEAMRYVDDLTARRLSGGGGPGRAA